MKTVRFDDANVYVVGGSSGIGLATAKRLAARGTHTFIFARRPDVLAQAAAEIAVVKRPGRRVAHRPLDASNFAQVAQVMNEAVAELGAPDILINCAGRSIPRRFEQVTPAQLEETWRLNLGSCWNTVQALLPCLKARGGYIVNTASLAGLIGVFGYTDYCASKFALVGFSEALRSELKPYGIRVSVLCPPDTDTPGFIQENQTKPEETRAISAKAKLMSADAVADALLRGMQRGRFLIVPGLESKVALLAKRLSPGLVSGVIDGIIRRVRTRSGR